MTSGAVGTLVGLEIPLLMRILKDRYRFNELVASGALLAATVEGWRAARM